MVLVLVLLGVVLLVVSVVRLRSASPGSTWPFVTSALLSGSMVALSAGGALVALTVGRSTWNGWTAGTAHRETVTLTVLLVGVPLLLALAVAFLLLGTRADRRRT